MAKTIKATLVKSRNHRNQITLETLRALGLKKIGTSRSYPDNPAVRGMLAKMSHLLEIEEIKG
jgi:large subunit ribosomal protein L30